MKIKFYNLNILQDSKVAWEKEEIKNPRFSLKGLEIEELSLDEVEEMIVDSIRKSFSELKGVVLDGEFKEAKIIMPALQMSSTESVVDFGISIIVSPEENTDESLSDWNHPSEMWEEFANMTSEHEDSSEIEETEEENELDIIRKSIEGK
jgi:hypothetical protein